MSHIPPKLFFWFDGIAVQGPVTGVEMRELAFQGKITPTTQVQLEGHDKWVEARRLKGLFDAQGKVLPHPQGTEGVGDEMDTANETAIPPPVVAPSPKWNVANQPASRPPLAAPVVAVRRPTTPVGQSPLAPAVHAGPVRKAGRPSNRRMGFPGSVAASLIDMTRDLYKLVGGSGGAWRTATFLWAVTTFTAIPYQIRLG